MNSLSERVEHLNNGNYPPYNIIQLDENNYRVELAVAGFKQDEIDITVEDGQLKVAGFQETITNEDGELEDTTYIHRGISARSFERSFALSDHLEVEGAAMDNGILSIALVYNVPEALKPKRIEIK
jgi:molecular chaperone IbpA